ncbi:sigma-70 family RNA polymerase sigma factor [Frankia sp. EAN1pec]|uniref:sigma-70 family RNA polymerase sigma factor n=1 Tax=Parafrankia sp. (strain EAN1pec) TaxID=298653 RepID=UPI0007C4DB7F
MARLYRDHHRVLLSFIGKHVDDRHRAEDIAQETLLRAWRNRDSLRPDGVRSYLFTIARNVITDAWRAERRRPSLGDDGGEVVAAAPAVDDVSQAIEEWVVAEALGRISLAHRAVVQELYYEGRSVREAAARLALPEGTVKSRVYYAIRALRDAFEEMTVGSPNPLPAPRGGRCCARPVRRNRSRREQSLCQRTEWALHLLRRRDGHGDHWSRHAHHETMGNVAGRRVRQPSWQRPLRTGGRQRRRHDGTSVQLVVDAGNEG